MKLIKVKPIIRFAVILVFGGMLLYPTMLLCLNVNAYFATQSFKRKLMSLLEENNSVSVTASELFGINETEFLCVIDDWYLGRPLETNADFSVLEKFDLTIDDMPNYTNRLDFINWDFNDDYVMSFSATKRRLRRIVKLHSMLSSDSVYGCYPYLTDIEIKSVKRGKHIELLLDIPKVGT